MGAEVTSKLTSADKDDRRARVSADASDYRDLFERTQTVLLRMLLSRGDVWAALEADRAVGSELEALASAFTRSGTAPEELRHADVLLRCAGKLNEISGPNWKSDLARIRVSDFGADEYIVKYPDDSSDVCYYFRLVDGDVSPILME